MHTAKSAQPFAARVQKRFITITVIALFSFMVIQIFILSSVGTIGPNISKVRTERERLYVENEVKEVNIRDLQTQGNIVAAVSSDLQMNSVQLQRLELKDATVDNQQNIVAIANY